MKPVLILAAAGIAMAAAFGLASAQDTTPEAGPAAVDKTNPAPPIYRQDQKPGFKREYEDQPPLIPHSIDRYRLDLSTNRCLSCHDKPNYKKEEAPVPSASHYLGPDGKEQATIQMRRYFCTQCHVLQVDAPPLVRNTFRGEPSGPPTPPTR